MTVVRSLRGIVYVKRRPGTYKARDAPYAVGGNRGAVLAKYPGDYPLTSQQRKIKEAAKACGIKKGMSKADLMNKMKDCIPSKF